MGLDLSKLENLVSVQGKQTAACPACREAGNDKKGDHLVVWPDGRFGCVSNPDDAEHRKRVFALVGLRYENPPTRTACRQKARRASSWPTAEAAAAAIVPTDYALVALYRYGQDAAVARYETGDGDKTFRQFHLEGSAWVAGAPDGKWPLFGTIQPKSTSPIVLVSEGEKAALAATSIGLPCVCSAGGSAAAPKTDWSPLAGRKVAILPDNDAPGKKYAGQVATILASLNPPAIAKTVILPDLPASGDIADFIESRDSSDAQTIAEEIMGIVLTAFDRRKETSPKNGRKGGRPAVTKEVADAFVESLGNPMPLRRHRGAWFKYDKRTFRPYTTDDLHSAIMGFLRTNSPDCATKNMVANIAANLAGNDLAGVESCFQMPCWLPGGDPASGWIAMRNLIVNANGLARRISGAEIEDSDIARNHSVDFFSTFALEYDYDPNAKCPIWEEYLNGVQPDPEMRDMLQMLMGLCLVPDCSYEVFFVLYGGGGCGKNVFLSTLEGVVGRANICALPLSKFGEKHSAHLLTENLVNIVGDLPTSDGKTSLNAIEGILKDAVSGGLIACERKNQEPYQAHAIARNIFATNSLPTFADRSDGVWDRIRIIPFDVKFRDTDKQNPYLKEQIAESELSGVFNWAVEGLSKLRSLRRFPRGPKGQTEEQRHRKNCDHEAQFLLDNYTERNGAFVDGSTIYQDYRSFCMDNGYRPKNSANFSSELRRIFPRVVEDRRMISGVRLRGFMNIEKIVEFDGGNEEI